MLLSHFNVLEQIDSSSNNKRKKSTGANNNNSDNGSKNDNSLLETSEVEKLIQKVPILLECLGLDVKLRNQIYKYDAKAKLNVQTPVSWPHPVVAESLVAVDTVRKQWDTRLRYEIRSIAVKQKRELIHPRDLRNKVCFNFATTLSFRIILYTQKKMQQIFRTNKST